MSFYYQLKINMKISWYLEVRSYLKKEENSFYIHPLTVLYMQECKRKREVKDNNKAHYSHIKRHLDIEKNAKRILLENYHFWI